ncbi:MAG: TMEM43 family protein [Desulfococcaceae bacterium]
MADEFIDPEEDKEPEDEENPEEDFLESSEEETEEPPPESDWLEEEEPPEEPEAEPVAERSDFLEESPEEPEEDRSEDFPEEPETETPAPAHEEEPETAQADPDFIEATGDEAEDGYVGEPVAFSDDAGYPREPDPGYISDSPGGGPVIEESEVGDSHVVVSEEGYLSRLKGALAGMVMGILVFVVGFPVLFLNEGRAVRRYRALKEGAGSVVSISPDRVDPAMEGKLVHVTGTATTNEMLSDSETADVGPVISIPADRVDPANEGRLVHVSGRATTDDRIPDRDFGFAVPAIRLERSVRMYQWREVRGPSQTDTKLGGGTETRAQYTYEKVWSDAPISSARFHAREGHQNPGNFPYVDQTFATPNVHLGAFKLPPEFISDINRFEPLRFKSLPPDLPATLANRAHVVDGDIFIGRNPREPDVGDLRVSWRRVEPPVPVSLVARQTGDTFAPYPAPDGRGIAVFSVGDKSAEELLPRGISVNAVQLRRTVEMYQWRERENIRTVTGSDGKKRKETTFTYEKVWSERPIDSSRFRQADRNNPANMPFEGKTVTAQKVTVGDFALPADYIDKMTDFKPLPPDQVMAALPPELAERAAVRDDSVYIAQNPDSPRIGDLRIRYGIVQPAPVTVVAAQAGRSFKPYQSPVGGTIEEFRTGTHSADAIFGQAQKRNTTMTWLLRVGGFALMFIGLLLVLRPLSVAMDVVPFLGNLAGKGVALIAFLIAAGCALVTIAIAWFFYRPLLSAGLIVGGIALVFGVKWLRSRDEEEATGGPPPPPPGATPPPPGG